MGGLVLFAGILLVWVVSTLGFAVAIIYQVGHDGYEWIVQSPFGIMILGLVANYAFLSIIVYGVTAKNQSEELKAALQAGNHEELIAAIRSLNYGLESKLGVLELKLDVLEGSVHDLDRQMRQLR